MPLDDVYSAIGNLLKDNDIEKIVLASTGNDIYNVYCAPGDPREEKIRKTIEKLAKPGNDRWVLTYILFYLASQGQYGQSGDKVSRKIVEAFPKSLIELPSIADQVDTLLNLVLEIFKIPMPLRRKLELLTKPASFVEVEKRIVALRDYAAFHETCLLLMFALDYFENLLANHREAPGLDSVARQMDQVAQGEPVSLKALWAEENPPGASIAELTRLSAALRNAGADSGTAAQLLDEAQRILRIYLLWLNRAIFRGVDALDFVPLISDLPGDMESLPQFTDLVQGVRDLKTTLLARVLKHKMWQDTENEMTLVGKLFDAPHSPGDIGRDWLPLRSRIVWLAKLEPAQQWTEEANRYADTIDLKLFAERSLDETVAAMFEEYRNWLRGPLKSIDAGFKGDCLSLGKIDDPLQRIRQDLTL